MATFTLTPWPEAIPYEQQSYQVPDTKEPGQTAHYRNVAIHDLPTPGSNPKQTVSTTYECFEVSANAHPKHKCLGYRPTTSGNPEKPETLQFRREYVWSNYSEVAQRRLWIGSAIQALFNDGTVGGGDLDTVGTWTINRPEWQLIDLALAAYSKIGVALYSTLGRNSVEYIINHAEITLVFVAARNMAGLLAVIPNCPKLRVVVSIDSLDQKTFDQFESSLKQHDVRLMTLSGLETTGKAKPLDPIPPTPDSIATICYSSGTTANPKGVVLTHWNITSSAISFSQGLKPVTNQTNPSVISYLPLAHIVGRQFELCALLMGYKIGYYSGDPLKLLEDAQILKPEIFPAVPRILNRIAGKLTEAKAAGGLKGFLINWGLSTKIARIRQDGTLTHWFWDALLFNRVKAALGGKVELIVTGAAPLVPEVAYMLRASIGCEVVEGWGLTETCGSGARTLPGDPTSPGTVGTVSYNVEVKLVDVPHLGYSAEDKPNPRGELCVRGASVFREYYKELVLTAEAKDNEGWFHTGDVGEIDEHKRIKIIDRVKNVMKLAQGEYVAIEKVEGAYSTCPISQQIFVYGQSSQSFLVALLVPEFPALAQVASKVLKRKVDEADKEALKAAAADEGIKKEISSMLEASAKDAGLLGFEKIKNFRILLDPFTTENQMMTPTFKLRRKQIEASYKEALEELYKEQI